MKFVFLDEHESDVNGRTYTAVSCAVFDETKVVDFRNELVPKLGKLFWPNDGDKIIIRKFPKIHGSDLLSDWPDEIKIACVETVLQCAMNNNCQFFRLGYFDDKMPPPVDRKNRVGFCVANMIYPVQEAVEGNFYVIHEMDIRSIDAGYLSPDANFDRYLQHPNFKENMPIEIDRILGFAYAAKSDFGCIAADLFGYVCSKYRKTELTAFGEKIASCYEITRANNVHDEIIDLVWDEPKHN